MHRAGFACPLLKNGVENHSQVFAGSALASFRTGIYLALVEVDRRWKADHRLNPRREI
jgi:hypothetical protein